MAVIASELPTLARNRSRSAKHAAKLHVRGRLTTVGVLLQFVWFVVAVAVVIVIVIVVAVVVVLLMYACLYTFSYVKVYIRL